MLPKICPILALALLPVACGKATARIELADPHVSPNRVHADTRATATAIESYRIDWNVYPAWDADPKQTVNAPFFAANPALAKVPSFKDSTLTTPIAYLTGPFNDPYAEPIPVERTIQPPSPSSYGTAQNLWYSVVGFPKPYQTLVDVRPTFAYWTSPVDAVEGWIIWSQGPDRDYDLTTDNIAAAYNPKDPTGGPRLHELTYDPSNGADSGGDIWRIKGDLASPVQTPPAVHSVSP